MMKQMIVIFTLLMAVASAAPAIDSSKDSTSIDLYQFEGRIITGIVYSGLNHTKEFVVTREVRSQVGDPLDLALLKRDRIRLQNLPIFGAVNVFGRPDSSGVIVEFIVSEFPWIIPHPSINYTEENGFSLGGGVKALNMFGRGAILKGRFLLGGINTFNFEYFDPWIAGNHISIGLDAGHTIRQNELLDFKEVTDLVTLVGGTWIGDSGRLSGNLGYKSIKSDKDGITLDPDNQDKIFFGNIILGYDTRNSYNEPRSGWQNEWFNATYSGGNADFWTLQFDFNRYQPIKSQHSIAFGPLLSFQSGMVGVDIPAYSMYFMGGSNSIRGYKLEELGLELYGKNQFLFNLEYRWNFFPMRDWPLWKWSVAAGLQFACFADAGIAWNQAEEFNLKRARFGYGVGLRLMLPVVETLRFDMGVSQYGDIVFNFGVNSIFFGRRQKVR